MRQMQQQLNGMVVQKLGSRFELGPWRRETDAIPLTPYEKACIIKGKIGPRPPNFSNLPFQRPYDQSETMYMIPRSISIDIDHREPPNRTVDENLAAVSLPLPIGPLKSASKNEAAPGRFVSSNTT